jgi:hypothetical protein
MLWIADSGADPGLTFGSVASGYEAEANYSCP